ncbi:hypothetical protein [Jatrophihabitans sp.]|uniref:hypothetical protein n=1 Tax=Jatrophihabitans sp. TaxID=1932789 RepID=UPI0030C6B606|nr:hypothetical protein [Jatrophihabitans sp.]
MALLVAVGGFTVAYASYRDRQGPAGAVRGYLKAVARGDASAALGYGRLPAGGTPFLTAAVLHQQLQIAPLRDVTVVSTSTHGSTAKVTYSYSLDFSSGEVRISDTVGVVKEGGRWVLSRVAATPDLTMTQASDRASLAGVAVPTGRTALFPGAIPITFDTPYLRLTLDTEQLRLSDTSTADLTVELTGTGNSHFKSALSAALAACASGASAVVSCPVPSSQFVPGSMRGTLHLDSKGLALGVEPNPAGSVSIAGTANFVGTYRTLDFNDIAQSKKGKLTVPFQAVGYAVEPLSLRFVGFL